MTLRNTSGKFSLPSFGRKASGADGPATSPSRGGGNGYDDDGGSPHRDGSSGFSGLGEKLGKSIAHQSLLPVLGNKDMRLLQDVITSEKGAMQMTEKLAIDTQKAAAALPPYGAQEGPDLQDVLTHSSTLLNHLSTALTVFTTHQSNMRTCYKRIREREEALDELRRRRRHTGSKAETAERKLAKMGPENKGLPQQTELLEKLRIDMRQQMDTDIVNEESKLGDFKRQTVKEALSLKFGGLEELGEKMCIIGELGKLLLEEIPLEETPPGYGRAPYYGYEKTENAVTEATKCLATVQFHAASNAPKAPALAPHTPAGALTAPTFPTDERRISAAEDYAHLPGNVGGRTDLKGKGRDYSLDDSPYGEYGGERSNGNQVVWQGPTDEALASETETSAQAYEYEQQRALDAEEAAWREQQTETEVGPGPDGAITQDVSDRDNLTSPWEPLQVRRSPPSPEPQSQPQPQPIIEETAVLGAPIAAPAPTIQENGHNPDYISMPPPPTISDMSAPPTPGAEGFYTPLEGPSPPVGRTSEERFESPAITSLPIVPVGGKISAAAFRRAAKPRTSLDPDEVSASGGIRRLPVPPLGGTTRSDTPSTLSASGVPLPVSPSIISEDQGNFADAPGDSEAPPVYGHQTTEPDSLR
ncbi:Eisosome component PIL1-domain-containing protein [Naematelia encephala]|uniref:Eisosome component PIL1-domain-containing protein n=1 Tax=Naematelia encephala TaxID=71784 RepID=A0A1Y2AD23_9TREE|nr:Eisosome component PIL1-domain-containing protein [Naematelia encephala]